MLCRIILFKLCLLVIHIEFKVPLSLNKYINLNKIEIRQKKTLTNQESFKSLDIVLKIQ